MKEAYKKKPGRVAAGRLVLGGIAVLLAAAVSAILVFQVPARSSLAVIQQASASERNDGPRIIGGFVPEKPKGIPSDTSDIQDNRDNHERQETKEPFFLSWNFINGLFLGILVLEFLIFPILFWMWFGLNGSDREDLEKNAISEPKKNGK